MRYDIHINKTELVKAIVQQVFENLLVIAVAVIVVFVWSKFLNG